MLESEIYLQQSMVEKKKPTLRVSYPEQLMKAQLQNFIGAKIANSFIN